MKIRRVSLHPKRLPQNPYQSLHLLVTSWRVQLYLPHCKVAFPIYVEPSPQEPLLILVISSQLSQESRLVGAAGTLTSSNSS